MPWFSISSLNAFFSGADLETRCHEGDLACLADLLAEVSMDRWVVGTLLADGSVLALLAGSALSLVCLCVVVGMISSLLHGDKRNRRNAQKRGQSPERTTTNAERADSPHSERTRGGVPGRSTRANLPPIPESIFCDSGMPEAAGSAQQSQTRHMTPCACHCAACHAAGHGSGVCVLLCAGLHDLFEGQHDVVDVVLRQYYGACSWGTARFDEAIRSIRCVRYGPAGDVIAAGGGGGDIHLICAQTGVNILCPLRVDGPVWSVVWSPCGKKVAAACNVSKGYGNYLGSVKIFTQEGLAGTLVCQSTLRGHGNAVTSLSFKPDAPNVLVTGSWDKTVKLWDLSTSTCLSTMKVDSQVLSVAYSPDGTKLTASLCYPSYSVVVFDTQTNEQICSLNVGGVVFAVVFAACGNKLAASCNDYPDFTVKILSKEGSTGNFAYQPTAREMKVDYRIFCLSYAPNGDMLAVGDEGGNINVFNSQGEKLPSPVIGHRREVSSVSYSPDGTKLASGSDDMTVRIWEAGTGKQLSQLRGHTLWVQSVAWSLDGTQLASGSQDKTVRLWHASTNPPEH